MKISIYSSLFVITLLVAGAMSVGVFGGPASSLRAASAAPFDVDMFVKTIGPIRNDKLTPCINKLLTINDNIAATKQLITCKGYANQYNAKIKSASKKSASPEVAAAKLDADTDKQLLDFATVGIDLSKNGSRYPEAKVKQKTTAILNILNRLLADFDQLAASYPDTAVYQKFYPEGVATSREGFTQLRDLVSQKLNGELPPAE